MRQKLDIADVEERTKIRAKYLRALENEEWGLLPGPTFVKTFLRTYAEVVGVDPHLLVEEYRTQHETEEQQDLQPISPSSRRRPPPSAGPPGRLTVLLALFAAVVVFLLVLGLAGGDDEGGGGDTTTEAARTERTTEREPARTAPAKKARTAPTGVSVRIAPDGPTYACLDTGEGSDQLFEGTLEKARTFRNAKELRVNLGRRSGQIKANGKAVKVTQSPEPLGLRITKAGAEEITEGARPCA